MGPKPKDGVLFGDSKVRMRITQRGFPHQGTRLTPHSPTDACIAPCRSARPRPNLAPHYNHGARSAVPALASSQPGRVWQDWEATTYATYIASFTVITIGLTYAPRTSLKAWARDEALARNGLEGEAEYGTCYSGGDGKFKFVKGAVGERPALAGSADEDEEDDE